MDKVLGVSKERVNKLRKVLTSEIWRAQIRDPDHDARAKWWTKCFWVSDNLLQGSLHGMWLTGKFVGTTCIRLMSQSSDRSPSLMPCGSSCFDMACTTFPLCQTPLGDTGFISSCAVQRGVPVPICLTTSELGSVSFRSKSNRDISKGNMPKHSDFRVPPL